MSDPVLDAEVVTVRDPETDETFEAVIIPEGYVLCLIPQEMADAHKDWRECAAVRIEQHGDGTASVDISDDLDWLTSEDGPQ